MFAVGHFYNEPFIDACTPWIGRIGEVFFAWPGVLSCRPAPKFDDSVRERLYSDLQWCRKNGIRLDTLFNANCYGDNAISPELADEVTRVLTDMEHRGLFPDIVTTTSPFIASVLRKRFPSVKIRASINMRIHGTIGFEAAEKYFDEFYLSRENHRDFSYVRQVSKWAKEHGKLIGMQVNSGCLRECPFQTFHDNLHGHGDGRRPKDIATAAEYDFSFFRCKKRFEKDCAYEDFIRATWIRPEDVPLWEPYVSIFKVAIRRHPTPIKVLNAYLSGSYNGNLLDLMDPVHSEFFPYAIDNKSFPTDFARSGIGARCAGNCEHCGRCAEVLKLVAKEKK